MAAAVRPTAPGGRGVAGPVLPVVQRRADDASGGEGASHSGAGTDRPALGGPVAPDGTPHRPSARTGARARGGLGAPLPALPPSARPSSGSVKHRVMPNGRYA
ncbi:hypothetical protein ABT026_28150, partial [Streptomyces sp. NPDC002734]